MTWFDVLFLFLAFLVYLAICFLAMVVIGFAVFRAILWLNTLSKRRRQRERYQQSVERYRLQGKTLP